ncbi:MAG: hypothetical protein BWY85_01840 [Firmicutes bacterium ADurb.Bin506]|nr:MAG: hypothetical protein BWY85_01840 [Firmicutes bacterium ADurb.Bin506]
MAIRWSLPPVEGPTQICLPPLAFASATTSSQVFIFSLLLVMMHSGSIISIDTQSKPHMYLSTLLFVDTTWITTDPVGAKIV